ncbi:hypothetical protein BKA83DRAFT_378466 [Pisolithus microcarpus]|nr:hypothetical protein BKA83DRAFT_378466 [Pisolithus microcarpus]
MGQLVCFLFLPVLVGVFYHKQEFRSDPPNSCRSVASSSPPPSNCPTGLCLPYLPQFMASHLAICPSGCGDIPSFSRWGGLGRFIKYYQICFISITTLVGIRHPLHLYPPNHTVARNCIRNISLNSWPITSPFLLAVMEIFQVFAVGVALDEFLNIITSSEPILSIPFSE